VAMAALKKSSIPAYDTRFVMQTSPFFLTENNQDDDIFRDLSKYPATMVFYMALWNLENLMNRLTEQYPENFPWPSYTIWVMMKNNTLFREH